MAASTGRGFGTKASRSAPGASDYHPVSKCIQPEESGDTFVRPPSMRAVDDSTHDDENMFEATPELRSFVAKQLSQQLEGTIEFCETETPKVGDTDWLDDSRAQQEGVRLFSDSIHEVSQLDYIPPPPQRRRKISSSSSNSSEDERLASAAVTETFLTQERALLIGLQPDPSQDPYLQRQILCIPAVSHSAAPGLNAKKKRKKKKKAGSLSASETGVVTVSQAEVMVVNTKTVEAAKAADSNDAKPKSFRPEKQKKKKKKKKRKRGSSLSANEAGVISQAVEAKTDSAAKAADSTDAMPENSLPKKKKKKKKKKASSLSANETGVVSQAGNAITVGSAEAADSNCSKSESSPSKNKRQKEKASSLSATETGVISPPGVIAGSSKTDKAEHRDSAQSENSLPKETSFNGKVDKGCDDSGRKRQAEAEAEMFLTKKKKKKRQKNTDKALSYQGEAEAEMKVESTNKMKNKDPSLNDVDKFSVKKEARKSDDLSLSSRVEVISEDDTNSKKNKKKRKRDKKAASSISENVDAACEDDWTVTKKKRKEKPCS